MRLLVDNCVDRKVMRKILLPHDSEHASRVGADQFGNGHLLDFAARLGYDGLVTVDRQMEFEHKLAALPLPLLILTFDDSRAPSLASRGKAIREAVLNLRTHRFVKLDRRGVLTKLHPLDENPLSPPR